MFYCVKFPSAASKFNIMTLGYISLIVQIIHFLQLFSGVFLWLECTLDLDPDLGIWELKCSSDGEACSAHSQSFCCTDSCTSAAIAHLNLVVS